MKAPRKRTRRRFKGETRTFSITLPKPDRDWIDGLARPRSVGAVEIIRDALALYKVVLRVLAPRRRITPPIADITTIVRAALDAYLAQQRAVLPADAVSASLSSPEAPAVTAAVACEEAHLPNETI